MRRCGISILLFCLLALPSPPTICQETPAFSVEFDKLQGTKAPSRLGDEGAYHLAFTPDSRLLVTLSGTGKGPTLAVWDVRKREKVTAWKVHTSAAMALTPDGTSVAVAGNDGQIHYYNWRTRKLERTWALPGKLGIQQVVCNEDGTLLAVATQPRGPGNTDGGSIHVWEVKPKTEKPRFSFPDIQGYSAHGGPVIAFVPGKKLLLSTGGDSAGKPSRHDLETQKTRPLLPNSASSRLAVSRDGTLWILDHTVWVDGKTVASSFVPRPKASLIRFTLCPKGRSLAAVVRGDPGGEPGLMVWDVVRTERQVLFKERVWVRGLKSYPRSVVFSPDSSVLAVATEQAVLLWDAKALLPVRDPVWLNEDLQEEVRGLRERIEALERRIKELEPKK